MSIKNKKAIGPNHTIVCILIKVLNLLVSN